MDLVCFCHIRWDFVYQRPQHLLSRFAKSYRVFYIEEPQFINEDNSYLNISLIREHLCIVVPTLSNNLSKEDVINIQQSLLNQFFTDQKINNYFFWYYTPMALDISRNFKPKYIVYDCMDELSKFKFAPASIKDLEKELFNKADIVFTGGHNLYLAKKDNHHNIHPFPSSIDKEHFLQARNKIEDPEDQALAPHPRFGFYGVIDERFDLQLIQQVAERKPEWQFIIIGPVIKIDPASLPRLNNIHYLGSKSYNELPTYLSGWNIAIIPFVVNESTRYISPTKTPEYLAGGKPVISTSIKDVVDPYGTNGLVQIADNADEFIQAAEKELKITDKEKWLASVDSFLSGNSWDETWQKMVRLIEKTTRESNNNIVNNLNKEVICLTI
jgi:UDP-galactopyranose mutase